MGILRYVECPFCSLFGLLPYISLTLLLQTVDAPSIWLVPELLELYPDAIGQYCLWSND